MNPPQMSPKTSSCFCAVLAGAQDCCVVVVLVGEPPQIEFVSKMFDCDCVVVAGFQILGWAGITGTAPDHPDEAPHMPVPLVPIMLVAAGCC